MLETDRRGTERRGAAIALAVAAVPLIVAIPLTLLFGYLNRAGRSALVAIAFLNGVARISLGAHNPLDIVGGLAAGVIVGSLPLLVVDRAWRDSRHEAAVRAVVPRPEVA